MNSEWIINQQNYSEDEVSYYETIFALSNGYVGIRNTIDFESEKALPGVYFSEVYEKTLVVKDEIVNAPNWLDIEFYIENERLTLTQVEILEFSRELNIFKGFITTRYRVKDRKKRITTICIESYLHPTDVNSSLIEGYIIPENFSGTVTIKSYLNYGLGNSYFGGMLPNVKVNHLFEKEYRFLDKETIYLEVQTLGYENIISMASSFVVDGAHNIVPVKLRKKLGISTEIKAVEKNKYRFKKFTAFYKNRDIKKDENIENTTINKLHEVKENGVKRFKETYFNAWKDRWEKFDLIVEGDEKLQKSIRYSIFQLLQSVEFNKESTNIASRGLTSEYHHGHFFFNTDIYKLPFFSYFNQSVSKSLLSFRYNSLNKAKIEANNMGYKGARFSEESNINGEGAGPTKIYNFIEGRTSEEWTGRKSHFIGALVVYSLKKYMEIHEDHEFMVDKGIEILLETSKFAMSLLDFDKNLGSYVINDVIGPDEYHIRVNNNFFTNYLLKFNIGYCVEKVNEYCKQFPNEINMHLKKSEVSFSDLEEWIEIANHIYLPEKVEGIYEQFEGYFSLEENLPINRDKNFRPIIPDELKEKIKTIENFNNQTIKQSDVIMLMSLFRDNFTKDEKKENLEYYDPKTLHESSLSMSHAALIALDTDNLELAYKYMLASFNFNLAFEPKVNYKNGIHLAGYAGGWLTFIEGFMGIKILDDKIYINPQLMEHWLSVKFKLFWKGTLIEVFVDKSSIKMASEVKGKKAPRIICKENAYILDGNLSFNY
ncbi:glycosyl hydrolase family 65 protein [Cytobacillus pseudoceanisediminis]|uniref:glycosyl hydrolase family 65 protein n=1 Tax=Cytobacillus pseudoceanisediminis TaxID=3051614 RepID=UPI003650EF8E